MLSRPMRYHIHPHTEPQAQEAAAAFLVSLAAALTIALGAALPL